MDKDEEEWPDLNDMNTPTETSGPPKLLTSGKTAQENVVIECSSQIFLEPSFFFGPVSGEIGQGMMT